MTGHYSDNYFQKQEQASHNDSEKSYSESCINSGN